MTPALLLRRHAWFALWAAPLLGALSGLTLWPHPASQLLPSMTHLLTLGLMVPLFALALGSQAGPLAYGKLNWPRVLLLLGGLWGFVFGLLGVERWSFYLGGHYAAPLAIYILSLQGARTAWARRQSGGLSGLGPALAGLFVIVNWGGMLVLDRFYGGKYAFFTGPSIVSHALGALLLFVLPWLYALQPNRPSAWPVFGLGASTWALYLYGWVAGEPQAYSGAALSLGVVLFLFSRGYQKVARSQQTLKLAWMLAALGLVLTAMGKGLDLSGPNGLFTLGLFLLFGLVLPSLLERQPDLRGTPGFDWVLLGLLLLGWLLALCWHWQLPLEPLLGAYAPLAAWGARGLLRQP